jgi:hypothetical protein
MADHVDEGFPVKTVLLQNHANKSRSTTNKNTDFYVENPNGKNHETHGGALTIIGGVLQYTRGQTLYVLSICVTFSHLFYDYLGLYIGANNSLSWRTRNRVVMCYV